MWPVPVGDDVLRWKMRAARTLHASHGVTFDVVQVEPPPAGPAVAGAVAKPGADTTGAAAGRTGIEERTVEGGLVEQALVRVPRVALGVVLDEQERVLLRWRHRFVADTFGWELPAGDVEPDEDAAAT